MKKISGWGICTQKYHGVNKEQDRAQRKVNNIWEWKCLTNLYVFINRWSNDYDTGLVIDNHIRKFTNFIIHE